MEEGGTEAVAQDASARGRPPRPDLCRRYARKQFAAGLPAILDRLIEESRKGSIPHLKALMTMAGLDKEEPEQPSSGRRRPRSLSELLLRELRRPRTDAEPTTKQAVMPANDC